MSVVLRDRNIDCGEYCIRLVTAHKISKFNLSIIKYFTQRGEKFSINNAWMKSTNRLSTHSQTHNDFAIHDMRYAVLWRRCYMILQYSKASDYDYHFVSNEFWTMRFLFRFDFSDRNQRDIYGCSIFSTVAMSIWTKGHFNLTPTHILPPTFPTIFLFCENVMAGENTLGFIHLQLTAYTHAFAMNHHNHFSISNKAFRSKFSSSFFHFHHFHFCAIRWLQCESSCLISLRFASFRQVGEKSAWKWKKETRNWNERAFSASK